MDLGELTKRIFNSSVFRGFCALAGAVAINIAAEQIVLSQEPEKPKNQLEIVQEKGLIAHWDFSRYSGKIAKDISGKGHDGTIYGATWEKSDEISYVLSFDGINDYVELSDRYKLSLTDKLTVCAWIQLDQDWRNSGTIVCKHYDVWGRGYTLRVTDDRRLDASLNGDAFFSETQIAVDKWTHVALTYDSSTGKVGLYLNGYKDTEASRTGRLTPSGHALRIGKQSQRPDDVVCFKGLIYEVGIYNYALPPEKIRILSSI